MPVRSGLSIGVGSAGLFVGFQFWLRAHIDAHLGGEAFFGSLTLLPLLAFVDGWLLRKLTSTQHKVGLWPQVLANPATYFNCYMAVWAGNARRSVANMRWHTRRGILAGEAPSSYPRRVPPLRVQHDRKHQRTVPGVRPQGALCSV